MADTPRKTHLIEGVAPDRIPYAELLEAGRPVILRALARDWPLVREGLRGTGAAMAYLASHYGGRPVLCFTGAPEIRGRFAYNADATGMNFKSDRAPLAQCFEWIQSNLENREAPSFYIGSTDVDLYFPGLRTENDLVLNHPMFERNLPLVGAWIGNRTIAAAHYDMSNNIACCMVGCRRFTLFPPEQVSN